MTDPIHALTGSWKRRPGVSARRLDAFRGELGDVRPPDDYLRFMRETDGGYGHAGENGLWIRLERLEDVIPVSRACHAPDDLWIFGWDRFGRALVFRSAYGVTRLAVAIPDTFEEAIDLGPTFQHALQTLHEVGKRLVKDAVHRPDAPFVPTDDAVVDRILSLARVRSRDLVYDLGCGDGRITIAAARQYRARAVGFDIDPARVKEAKENVASAGVGELVTIRKRNLYSVDLRPADVVILYLLPTMMKRLVPQLRQCRPGTRIVSHSFSMEGYPPKEEVMLEYTLPIAHLSYIYLWEAPLGEPQVLSFPGLKESERP